MIKKINFLDLTITNNNNDLSFKIYREPSTTTTTIHADSHHPWSHRTAAFNSFVHHLLTIPMSQADYNEEVFKLKYIAAENGYETMCYQLLYLLSLCW